MTSAAVELNYQTEARVRDYISLLKPRVMSLVVFTGFAGWMLAPADLHPLLGFVAMLCIALGSGAAGALNMWYERELDAKMERTKNRPIPAGRMQPESAFEFAIICAFASVFIMAFALNLLAAGILLLAILYYVFIYTIWLKPRTPQNIVIGGAAGAFPPIIGWAAATGNIGIEPVILFLITFMWTPPHFWALSLYKSDDYRKAGIPMLPVIEGKYKTRKYILIYTMLLIPVTLLPFIIGLSGLVYFIGALTMGILFFIHALNVFIHNEEKYARRMFAFSILYLFAIFSLLIIDRNIF